MEFKSIPFEYKVDEAGVFDGAAAVYGNVDKGGDVIVAGAFEECLKANGGMVPVLWQHHPDEPIGEGVLVDSPSALNIAGQLDMEDPLAQRAHRKMQKRHVKGLSIGYVPLKKYVADGIRYLEKIWVEEVSVVTIPMNPLAVISSAKNAYGLFDFEEFLRSVVEEIKAGRKISAANMNMLQRANECAKECSVHIEEMMRMASGEDEDEKSAEQLSKQQITELQQAFRAVFIG